MPPNLEQVDVLTPEELTMLQQAYVSETDTGEVSDPRFLALLSSLDPTRLSEAVSEKVCQPGEIIFREGEPGSDMYIIRAGRVAVVKGNFSQPALLGYRGPGEVIGEMALLEHEPRSASLVALEEMRLLRVGGERFQEVLEEHPFIQKKIMELLSARLRDSDAARSGTLHAARRMEHEIQELETEKKHLLELQRLRQETSDFIIHDLRNPLGVVSGIINMLEMVLPPEIVRENEEMLSVATSACSRLQRMIDSLLEVSRMEAGESELKISDHSPADLVEAAAGRIGPHLKRNLTVNTRIDPDLPLTPMDVERIDRVLGNLIDNAIKFSQGGSMLIAAFRMDNCVGFSVTDSGPGIPEQERERIFERFAQVTNEKARRRGFGLGLTYCRLAVEAHGGRIWIEPGDGGTGSRFIFTLPLIRGAPCNLQEY